MIQITPPQNPGYWINQRALTFSENDLDNPNRVAVSLVSGTVIMAYEQGVIDYAADGNFQKWTLKGYSTKLIKNDAHYIYARLSRTEKDALIVFSVNNYNLDGSITTVDEDGKETTTDPNENYFYIKIGSVTATDGTSDREVTYDSGALGTKKGEYESDGVLSEMFELNKTVTPPLIIVKKWFNEFTVKNFVTMLAGFILGEKKITDIKRSTDSNNEYLLDENGDIVYGEDGNPVKDPTYVPISDETIPTTQYVQEKLDRIDDKYIRKDQDDRTPHNLSIGGKTIAEGGVQIGDTFVSGFTDGKGAWFDTAGNGEVESLIIRRFLEVPELRYNRVTVRMGDSITSVAAGIIESVSVTGADTGVVTLKLEQGEIGTLEVDDLVMQIFSDLETPANNATETTDDGKGNRTIKGFATVYFEVTKVEGDQHEKVTYKLREGTTLHPYAMGPFVQRGNFNNTERQTIIYEGIYPKPYTRFMKNVNKWEFEASMIGMQIGSLDNLEIPGVNLSGYSAYVDNIYYTGFVFELTPQQKEEISAYYMQLSEYVGSVRVDSDGNIIGGEYVPLNVVTGEENVISGDENVTAGGYLLQTQIQAFHGQQELAFTSEATAGDGEFIASISPVGCTATLVNGVISITGITNFEYSYVLIDVNCEGAITFHTKYQVKVIKDGTSAFYADIDNEMDSVACDEDGKVLFGLPVGCTVNAWYGSRALAIDDLSVVLPDGVTAEQVTVTADKETGKVEVTTLTQDAPDVLPITIQVLATPLDVQESRNLTFTLNKVKQGESAVIYSLRPSVNSVQVDNTNQLTTNSVSCKVLRRDYKGVTELSALTDELTMEYRIDLGDYTTYQYPEEIAVTKDTQKVTFRLFRDGVLEDSEVIPVVKDGNGLKEIGEYYLANNDEKTIPSYEDTAWSTEIPELSEEARYLWNYELVSYTGSEPTRTTPCVIARWTKDGRGVKEVIEWYQVNNDKDNTPAYPHTEGDNWVSGTAPAMREDARYLWNYEEIVWTEGENTYTEPAVVGAMGETGATTPVLSVSHAAITRNSLGVYDPSTVIVTATRGTESAVLWITIYGEKQDGTIVTFEEGTKEASLWSVNLNEFSASDCKSLTFRAYLTETTDYNAPYLAQTGVSFVQNGEVGADGPMPRNRGKYSSEENYYYNDEYRDYTWDGDGNVWIRKGRGYTSDSADYQGAIKGIAPIAQTETEYWLPASVQSLTAINTALIDEADIAGFVFKSGKMVSKDWHFTDPEKTNIDATIILDGNTGYFECNNATVEGSIKAGLMSYKVLYGNNSTSVAADLTGYGMAYGYGKYALPNLDANEVVQILAYCYHDSRSLPPFTFVVADTTNDSIIQSTSDSWGKEVKSITLGGNTIHTFIGIADENGYATWTVGGTYGGSGDSVQVIVDSELSETSEYPVQNKVIYSELKKYVTLADAQTITGQKNFTGGLQVNGSPIVFDATKKYWKLTGDLLVTGGVTAYGNEGTYTPSQISDAVKVDGDTLIKDANGVISVNPNIDLGGGVSSWNDLEDIPNYLGSTGLTYALTIKNSAGTSLGTYNGSTASTITLPDYITKATADGAYVTALGVKDNYLTWTKNGTVNNLTVPFATRASRMTSSGSVTSLNTPTFYDTEGQSLVYNNCNSGVTNLPTGVSVNNANGLLTLYYGLHGTSGQFLTQLFFPNKTGHIYYRRGTGGASGTVFDDWKTLAFTDSDITGNAATATLATRLTCTEGTSDADRPMVVVNPDSTSGANLFYASKITGNYSTGTLKAVALGVDGISIKKFATGVLYIDASLVVTGGVTAYGTDSATASTVMDGVVVDGVTISKSGGKLQVIGGAGGGVSSWNDLEDIPNYLGSTGLTYALTIKNSAGTSLGTYNGSAASTITLPDYITKATADSTYVNVSTSEQTITKAKTFDVGCWKLAAAEKGVIYNRHMANSTWGDIASTLLYGIRNGIDFGWQETHWVIGNLRGNSTDSYGFGIGYLNSSNKLDPAFRITSTESYVNGNKVLHAGNYTDYTGIYYSSQTSRTANTVLAAPNGSAGTASFRKLVAADIPSLDISKITNLQTTLDGKSSTSHTHYIGTTQVQASSATQDLTGIGIINKAITIAYESDKAYIKNNAGHQVIFGGSGYASQAYFFKPMYGSSGATTAEMYIQNVNASGTATTTHSFASTGNAKHSGTLTTGGTITTGGNILPSKDATYTIGEYGNKFTWLDVNCINCGAVGNSLWLCGGTDEDIGVVIARSGSNSATGELCRFTDKGMVWKSGVIARFVTTGNEMQFKYNNADASSLTFNGSAFKPFITATNSIMLGRYDSRWKGVYLGVESSSASNASGVHFCNNSSQCVGRVSSSTSSMGIYSVGTIYIRGGCTGGGDGTITISTTGVTIDKSGNLLATGGITSYSDIRKKTKLEDVQLTLRQVAEAPLIKHYYNADEKKTVHVGSIAQYWAGLNDWFCRPDNDGFYTMEIQNAALASSISVARELLHYETKTDRRIRRLKARISELEEQVEQLKQKGEQ